MQRLTAEGVYVHLAPGDKYWTSVFGKRYAYCLCAKASQSSSNKSNVMHLSMNFRLNFFCVVFVFVRLKFIIYLLEIKFA